MLTIYRGRESIDKETFLYDRIRERGVPAIVLVPDQYTLAAERQALARLDSDVLLGIEILGFSRLGSRVLAESGDGDMHFIDRYGRHMLLARLLRGMEDDLSVFSGSVRKESFVKAVNDFISRAKQYEIGPADLLAMDESESDLLTRKLADLSRIFAAYEEALTGKFTDSEDLIDLWRDRIAQSRFLAENEIWLYGFDSFTPKNLSVIKALLTRAPQVHVLLTYDSGCRDEDLFRLSGIVTGLLADLAREAGCDCHIRDLKPQDTGVKPVRRAAGIRHLERTLYAVGSVPAADEVPASHEGIDIVRCANIYNEAESAASFVLRLLREEGLRFRDIVVICNDQEERTPIISRIFDEYGLDVFADRKRPLLSSPIAVFITGLLETAAYGYRSADVFRVLKTGLGPLADEEIEELENYVQKYRIKGKAWKQPFPKGEEEYGPEGLARIESLRQKAIALFTGFDAIYRAKGTNGDFVRRYYEFLSGAETGLADHIARLAQDQEAGGFADLAAETRQIWAFIMSAFGQIDTLIGDEPFRGRDLLLMLESGLSQMEVGVLPPTVDDILLGTMQRTRFGDVQALLVLGANEGVLPMEGSEETLFSPEELASLSEGDFGLGAAESIREMEEQLAIYRDFSRPARHLYLSYSVANEKAEELRPSELVTRLQDIFPGLAPANDVLNRADPAAMLGGSLNTLRHFTEMLKQAEKGQLLDPAWQVVRDWLAAENPNSLARVRAGLAFENRQEPLPPELAAALYHRDYLPASSYTMSPSQLERYGRCPFYHFVRFGLRPDELRSYEVSGREIGDLYHEVLMEFCKQLNEQDAWESITREESDDLVRALVAKAALSYREGLFELSADERYWQKRATRVACSVCWALVTQVRVGSIRESLYEIPFGRSRSLPPIVQETDFGTVYIEGRIDRVDLLQDGRAAIVDYKTGDEKFSIPEALAGCRLQLLLYLSAAQEGTRHPAGVFYFPISELQVRADGLDGEALASEINKALDKQFRMNGIMVDDPEVIREIAGDFEDASPILPLKRRKDGTVYASGRSSFLINEEEFHELQEQVAGATKEICAAILAGRIDILPYRSGTKTACTYCAYRDVCRFDVHFEGCDYRVVR